MMRIVLRGSLALAAWLVLTQSPVALTQNGEAALDLATFFASPNGLVRDTNGDRIADDVAARVVVPAAPSREDSAAAANIAARLGFETSALSLPLVLRDTDIGDASRIAAPILVGHTNAYVRQLVERGRVTLADLEPGQGLIAVVAAPLGGPAGLVVAGKDSEGTLAAATELAARLPRLWNMTGITLAGIAQQTSAYLRRSGIDARPSTVARLVVDRERRGLATVVVRTPVPAAQVARAQRALEDLERAHRRGLEPGTLNFAEVARTTVQLVSDGRDSGVVAVSRSGLNPRTLTPPIDPSDLAPDSPGDRGRPADTPAAGRGKVFDLTNVFSIDGWYGDAYTDLIPDRTDASIVIGADADAIGAAHIAGRLGLETTGITLPVARTDDDVQDPAREPSPILVGRDNRLVRDLEKIGRVRFDDLKPGEGAVQVVPNAFGGVTATTIAGADPAGTEAASMYLARRVPYVWDNTRGAVSLEDLRTELDRFLDGRSAAGQASQAWHELQALVGTLKGESVESFEAKLFLESTDPALDAFLKERLGEALIGAKVTVSTEAVTAPVPVIDETIDVPWEVDDVRAKVREQLLPKLKPGASVDLEVRVSEAPELRRALAEELRTMLSAAGAATPRVRVLSAYKQGFLWLTEQVIPELKGKDVRSVHITVAELTPDLSKSQKFYQVPSRWIHELYPVDEIFTRELNLAREQFHLELAEAPKDIYALEARDGSGRVIHTASFSPKFVPREYLDKFPGWASVDVTTGWVTAVVDGATVLDTRVETDPERFWNQYQSKVLPRIYDHVMRVTENRPLPSKQPFFRDLDVEVRMSEPDFRIGVDEELISSLESLHEDLYFVTLDFFDALGRTTVKQRLAGPGKVFPIIHPERRGQPGQVRILYAGNASTKAALQVRYRVKDGTEQRVNRDLGRIDTTAPVASRVVARADGVSEIEMSVEAKDDANAARTADALDSLSALHSAGLYRTALSAEHVDRLAVSIALQKAATRRVVRHTGQWAPSNVRRASARPALPLVTWDHVIGPDESEELVGKLAAFPEIRAYRAGRSYRGREISVIEATLPAAGELVSLAKLTALKPTIFITGRQHANEVSSTSHILKLAELLVTDPEYRRLLEKVNIVLHPVENPDGAQMAYDLQKLTPTHMLHAGRYSALGMDVASQVGVADPLLPEALVRGRLWHQWLPDIYLNPHGYPSHEWVQQFAGYVSPGFRSYWTTRGWYTSVGGLRDPRYPEHVEAVAAIREAVVREINSNADVRAMNLRHQSRYRRWAFGFSPYVYPQEIYKDTAIYYTDLETGELRGQRRATPSTRGGRWSMNAWPQVTFVSGGTEAPDETAQGEWLELVTKPGFSYLMAHIRYLRDGRYAIERIEENAPRDGASLTLLRVRPVRPGPARNATTTTNQ
jgi:hypothetical protein